MEYSDFRRTSAMRGQIERTDEPSMPNSAAKCVCVAVDSTSIRDRFRTALEQGGHRVAPIKSAAELLARVTASQNEIDLVLVDLRLSNSAGTELVAALRKLDEGRLPVLVFSGTVGSANDVRALSKMRVTGYINEHCAPSQILATVTPYLFPDSFNRRSGARVVLGIPVQYKVGSTIAATLTLNLSHRGVGIRTASELDAGTQVRVRFRLPGAETDVEADGRVAWSHRRVGMGVQFEMLDPPSQTQVDSFVDAHFLSNQAL